MRKDPADHEGLSELQNAIVEYIAHKKVKDAPFVLTSANVFANTADKFKTITFAEMEAALRELVPGFVQGANDIEYVEPTLFGAMLGPYRRITSLLAEGLLEHINRRIKNPDSASSRITLEDFRFMVKSELLAINLTEEQFAELLAPIGLTSYYAKDNFSLPNDGKIGRYLGIRTFAELAAIRAQELRAQIANLEAPVNASFSVRATPGSSKEATVTTPDRKTVFVIHGRNLEAVKQLGYFLGSMGLRAIEFDKLRAEIGATVPIAEVVREGMTRAQGVIALFTPDEYAAVIPEYRYTGDKPHDQIRWQSRPNVIFEAGMAFQKDPKRVLLLLLGNVELFTDVGGMMINRLTDSQGGRAALHTLLCGQAMGLDPDRESKRYLDHGDFKNLVAPVEGSDPFAVRVPPATPGAKTGAPAQPPLKADKDCQLRLRVWLKSLEYDAADKMYHFAELDENLNLTPGSSHRLLPAMQVKRGDGSWFEVDAGDEAFELLYHAGQLINTHTRNVQDDDEGLSRPIDEGFSRFKR